MDLAKYTKFAVPYIVVEYLFQCVLNLPKSKVTPVQSCLVLCLLCRSAIDVYPIIVSQMVNILVKNCEFMNVVCMNKFAKFFAHYIANNTGNWNWDELEFIVDLDAHDNRKLFLLEVFSHLQNHYDGRFKMDEPFIRFNYLLEVDRDSNYYYGQKTNCPETLVEIKKQIAAKIMANASCDELYSILDSKLAGYEGEPPFSLENASTKIVVQIHLIFQTLLAAHRHILSKTFSMIDGHKALLSKLVSTEAHQLIALYSVYQFWFKNPLKIKIVFFHLWKSEIVEPTAIIKFLLHEKMDAHLNKSYVWEILEEVIDSLVQKDEIRRKRLLERAKSASKKSRNKPAYKRNTVAKKGRKFDDISSEDDISSDDAEDLKFGTKGNEATGPESEEVLSEVLYALFEKLVACVTRCGEQYEQGTLSDPKVYFNTSQHSQHLIMKYQHLIKPVLNKIKELFADGKLLKNEHLSTIYSRFSSLTA